MASHSVTNADQVRSLPRQSRMTTAASGLTANNAAAANVFPATGNQPAWIMGYIQSAVISANTSAAAVSGIVGPTTAFITLFLAIALGIFWCHCTRDQSSFEE